MTPPTVPLPGAERFTEALEHVRSYVRSEPGAHTALLDAARRDPDGMTLSLVALGAVLLDAAAAAFRLTPDEVLAKVSEQVAEEAGLSTS